MLKHRGFTIVELLIVVVVIAILAAISVVAYNGIQVRARDNIRKSDLASLEKYLELNYIDNGKYTWPENMCTDTSYGGFDSCGATTGHSGDWDPNSDLRDLVTEGYMQNLPKDPINNSTYHYQYEVHADGQSGLTGDNQGYNLCARLESTGNNHCIYKRKN